ncbi:MAG: hypothetical protein K0S60_898, partial [Evtepia sp.]|nr:hypothetical protein [Evtepia sp.]
MKKSETKNKLLEVTKELLKSGCGINTITARMISEKAGTNLAMINYYFQSKDALLKLVVDELISEEFNQSAIFDDTEKSAKERLQEILFHVCVATIKFRELTTVTIQY